MRSFLFCLLSAIALWICQTSNAQVFRPMSDKGLSFITTGIAQDHEGFMWFSTTDGLYRYDSRSVKRYVSDPNEPASLPASYLSTILSDSRNRLWTGSWKGLTLLNREKDTFTRYSHHPDNPASIGNDTILCLFEDSRKQLWIGTMKGLSRVEWDGKELTFSNFPIDSADEYVNVVRAIAEDPNGDLWLGTSGGLVRFPSNGDKPERFLIRPVSRFSPENEIQRLYFPGDGSIWACMRAGGLNRFDPVSRRFEHLPILVTEKHPNPIVFRFLPDKQGKLWIPTWEGLACYDAATSKTTWYTHDPADPLSPPGDVLMDGYIDRQQGLWLGSYRGGVSYLNVAPGPFLPLFFYQDSHLAGQFADGWFGITKKNVLWSISDNQDLLLLFDEKQRASQSYKLQLPYSMQFNHFYLDEQDILWCAGSSTFSRLDLKTGRRDDFPFFEQIKKRGTVRRILEIDSDRLLLLGQFGAFVFDRHSRDITPAPGITNTIVSGYLDPGGNIWLGGKGVVFRLDKDSSKWETIRPVMPANNENDIWKIAEDPAGRIWFVTGYGLWLFDEQARNFSLYQDFGHDFFVEDLMSDKDGFLWVSTERQLIRYHPEKKTTRYFGEADGLPRKATLRVDAAFSNRDGTFFYPTNKGAFCFTPENVSISDTPARIVISSLKLFNKEVRLADSTGIFKKEISIEKELIFRHNQSIFTLDFAYLSYFKSDQNQYAYKLEGFEKDWNYVDVPSATYTNLPVGSYTFMVKAANGDGYWSPEPLQLKITVLPPWWKTWYAYALYILAVAGVAYSIVRFFWLRKAIKQENELYQAKLDFFTNISHEIRTHLSLISGPVDRAYDAAESDGPVRHFLTYARSNSNRLMTLVNELLDFRKIQNGTTRLRVKEQDLTKLLKNTLAAFEHTAAEKDIKILQEIPDRQVMLWLDIHQMQKVLYNLLGNAFKFTPEGGTVSLAVTGPDSEVTIKVRNSGPGIAPQHLEHLFTNFYQVYESSESNTGYGIGLALSKEIIERHRGELSVTSRVAAEKEEGETCFSITLLKGKAHFADSDMTTYETTDYQGDIAASPDIAQISADVANTASRHSLLVIEDNDELRAFAVGILRASYRVLEADNGKTGLALAGEHMPDVVVCDVMMPDMNGLEVCRGLRSHFQTRHIPIILVSARSASQQMVEGFEAGADAYLIKPFDFRVLELQIANLIKTREGLREKTYRAILLEPGEPLIGNPDEEFIARLRDLVIENLSEVDFGVNELAHQTGISVSVLYRKLRALTGMTVNEFSKELRMQRALKLLESGIYHVNEVARIVGFDDSKYFSREFRKTFGKHPSEVKKSSAS